MAGAVLRNYFINIWYLGFISLKIQIIFSNQIHCFKYIELMYKMSDFSCNKDRWVVGENRNFPITTFTSVLAVMWWW